MSHISRRQAIRTALLGAAVLTLPRFFINVGAAATDAPAAPVAESDPKKLEISELLANLAKAEHSLNKMPDFPGQAVWDVPIIAYASAQDSIFNSFKDPKILGNEHLTPAEWLPDAKTVITYFIPFTDKIKQSNRIPGAPSLLWVESKNIGEKHITQVIGEGLVQHLSQKYGANSIQPGNDPRSHPKRPPAQAAGTATNSAPAAPAKFKFVPAWSERHAGYVAGLGTFGLHKSLITARGAAGRLGSVITNIEIAPTVRPYANYYSYCPFLTNGGCGACIKRCPAHAVSDKTRTKDDTLCRNYTKTTLADEATYKGYHSGCGKCVTATPCESRIPPANLKRIAYQSFSAGELAA